VHGGSSKFQKYDCKETVGKKSTKNKDSQPKEILKPGENKGNKVNNIYVLKG